MLDGFRKYYIFARTAFRDHTSHRMKLSIRVVLCLFFMFVFVEFWRLIGREEIVTLPYAIIDICWYASLTQMFLFMSPRMFMTIEQDVRSGDIAYALIRPMPYIWMRLSEAIGAMTGNTVVYYTIGISALYLYIGDLPTAGLSGLLSAMFFLYLASITHIFYQLMCGVTALWLQDGESIYRIYQKTLIVLGGLYMPITLYPEWVQTLAYATPVSSMMFAPAQFVLGEASPLSFMTVTLMTTFWLGLSGLATLLLFRICTRRLEINGG